MSREVFEYLPLRDVRTASRLSFAGDSPPRIAESPRAHGPRRGRLRADPAGSCGQERFRAALWFESAGLDRPHRAAGRVSHAHDSPTNHAAP
jgi:hypothetical protein